MRLGYDLTIEQTQKLTMTPELIQAIQILQFNSQELEEYVQEELIENPVLELDSSFNVEENDRESKHIEEDIDFRERVKYQEREFDDISYRQWEYSEENEDGISSFEKFTSNDETLLDVLLLELSTSSLEGIDRKIGRYIIESLDDNGYLHISSKEIADAFNTTVEHIEDVLDVIQTFDPLGIGARTLEECLAIQLREKKLLEKSVEYILLNHLKDIAENRLNNICKKTGMSIKDVQMVADLIRSLEPKPGRAYEDHNKVKYIIPDVFIDKIGDEYIVHSNDDIVPNLVVSKYYVNLLNSNPTDKELNKYLNEKYDQANWLIRSIEQRKKTIYNVVNSVLNHQIDFIKYGPKYLKTLTLREVAEDVGVHESTVSRSINGKYMQTPRGVYEIKYFFSSGVNDINGEGMSSNSVKTYIKEIVDKEDPYNPYSDQQMVEILSDKGIEISRRTVSKYRESLNILSSSKRRRF